MERWTIRGYANQVRLFLSLLVFFLAMQGALNFTLLFTAREGLVAAVRSRLAAAAGRIANEIPEEPPAAGVLAALARRHGVREVVLLDTAGLVLATSGGPAAGELDPDISDLSPEDALGVGRGRDALLIDVPWRGEGRLALVRPLLAGDGRVRGMLKVVGEPDDLIGLVRRTRLFAVLQAAGIAAVLALTFAFIRWLLRPYRLLVRTAAAALPGPASEEQAIQAPGELVATFQGVVDKLRQHERDATALRASPLAGPAIRSLPSGIVATDASGRVSALNPAAARLLRVDAAWAMGRPYTEVLASAPELLALVAEGQEHGRGRSRVLVRIGSGPDVAHLGVSVSSVGPEPGASAGVLCLFSDLTEIRALEEKVRLRDSLAELGQLSAGIAHEVRNSFGTVLGYSKLLVRATEGEARENAEAIRREVESARGILDDYLRFARPVSLNLERVRLGDLVAEVVAGLRDDPVAEGREFVVDGEWVEIEADEGLLRQALVNLLRNGLEAAGPGGRVGVRGSLQGDPTEFLLEVHDSGPGLAADVSAADLFRPFFTTKAAGIGLGLPWVRKTVVYHDGRVDVGRGPWGGASFRIVLPLRRGSGEGVPASPSR